MTATESFLENSNNPCVTASNKGAVRRSKFSKYALLLLSVVIIWLIAGAWQIVAFILAVVVSSWAAIAIGDRIVQCGKSRSIFAFVSVATAIAAIITANVTGLIGTLTGTSASLQYQSPVLLGVTFYALQIAGVASDVFRREITRPTLIDFNIFILLCFKFYSGPVERASDLERIVNWIEPWSVDSIWDGFSWVLLGIFMKFVIANPLTELIQLNTADPISHLAVATVAELRVYFDFAGYSFMAFGMAKLAGISLTNNFQQPLFAPNLPDFWRRWHASFGGWLRRYVYLPWRAALQVRQLKTWFLAPSIFIISAMWHGGTVNFAIWGALHALAFLMFVKVLSRYRWSRPSAHLSIFALLVFARLLYIDPDTERLINKLADFVNPASWQIGLDVLRSAQLSDYPMRAMVPVGLSCLFLFLEFISLRRYGTHDYRLLRTMPAMAVMLLFTLTLVYDAPNAIFVYARN